MNSVFRNICCNSIVLSTLIVGAFVGAAGAGAAVCLRFTFDKKLSANSSSGSASIKDGNSEVNCTRLPLDLPIGSATTGLRSTSSWMTNVGGPGDGDDDGFTGL